MADVTTAWSVRLHWAELRVRGARRAVSRSRDGEPRGSLREPVLSCPRREMVAWLFPSLFSCSIRIRDHLCPISASWRRSFRRLLARACVCVRACVRVACVRACGVWKQKSGGQGGRERFEGRCRVSTKFAGDWVVFLWGSTDHVQFPPFFVRKHDFLREEEGRCLVSDRFYWNF